jgi:MYXO-CTERM domain-containing protein
MDGWRSKMRTFVLLGLSIPTLLSVTAMAAEPAKHPYSHWDDGRILTIDWRDIEAGRHLARPTAQPDLSVLDEVAAGRIAADPDGPQPRSGLPDGLVQRGGVVLPREIDDGTVTIEPEAIFAVEDIPGNAYPRKHTLYLNFSGGALTNGSDNSAEDKSQLALDGNYPVFTGGEAKAVSVAQAVQTDVAGHGVQVVYLERPPKTLPYTMAMVGGDWTDTNLEDPAGGVAPGADCGALGQRHVVYAFESGSALQMANTTSQEAGHGWGLDHNLNCGSVMSYCGGGDGVFSGTCDGLCENACQGAAGCRLTHEMFCGVGNDQQNEQEELDWLFGTDEPDMEDPTAVINLPEDGAQFDAPADVQIRAVVADDYGGFGWRFEIEKDGELLLEQVDYDRMVDEEYRASLNLTGFEAGTYVLRVVVLDHFGHEGVDEVTIQVGPGAGTGDDSSVDDTGDGTADDDDGTDDDSNDSNDDDDDDDDGTDDDGNISDDGGPEDRGCNCTSSPSTTWSGALILLALVGLRRRRAA